MGIRFPLRYTNLVGYFSTRRNDLQSTAKDLLGFFYMLEKDEWRLISSQNDNWPQQVREAAAACAAVVKSYADVSEGVVFNSSVEDARERVASSREPVRVDEPAVSIQDVFSGNSNLLENLRLLFYEEHDVFVLGVAAGCNDVENVTGFLTNAIKQTVVLNTLFLIPDPSDENPMDFIDPFPGASLICQHPERWPGVLFWNRNGHAVFLPLAGAGHVLFNPELLCRIAVPAPPKERMQKIEQEYASSATAAGQVRLLHLSDLHFGTKHAENRQAYLLAVIKDELEGRYDRIIITGDLFDSPWKRKWKAWDNFRHCLRLLTSTDPIVIPGNHDNRILGNRLWRFGESYRYLAELGVRPVQEDANIKCVFFCFNSSKKGNFARGEILEEDLLKFAAEYHVLAAQTPDIKNWLRIALVHHHPFKFDSAAEGMTAKLLQAAHIPPAKLLDMKQSNRFIRWCADRGVQLVLHGHRHVQRKITQIFPPQNGGGPLQVTAVGCGTSLGAEGIDASFNLVTWNPNNKRWSVTFYLDQSGGRFKEIRAASTKID